MSDMGCLVDRQLIVTDVLLLNSTVNEIPERQGQRLGEST